MAPRKAKPDPKSTAAAEGVAAAAGAAAPTPEPAPGLMPSHYAPLLPTRHVPLQQGVAELLQGSVLTAVAGTESWLYGYMDVQARAPMGFWRCSQHFLHSAPTRVFVVRDKALIPNDHSCDMLCAYLLPAEAQIVADEPHLKVLG